MSIPQLPQLDGKKYKILVTQPNNRGEVNDYIKNSFFELGWIMGLYGIRTVSKTYDEHPISVARNSAFTDCLDGDYTHILMADSDNILTAINFINILAEKKPVISGWYLSRKGTGLPVVMKRVGKFNGWMNKRNFNTYRSYGALEWHSMMGSKKKPYLVKVPAVGAGCMLIERKVLKKLKPPYFYESHTKFHDFGEDLWFSENCAEADIPIWVDKRMFVGHIGWVIYHREHWDAMLQADIERFEKDARSNSGERNTEG